MRFVTMIEEAMRAGLTFAIILGGVPLVLCLVLPWSWWLIHLVFRVRPRGLDLQVMATVAHVVEAGQAPVTACLRMLSFLPANMRRRVRRMMDETAEASLPTFLAVCGTTGLLPQRLARLAQAAALLGPEIAVRWLATAGRRPQFSARTQRLAMLMVGVLVALAGIMTFLSVIIFPRLVTSTQGLKVHSVLLDVYSTGITGPVLVPVVLFCLLPVLVWTILERWRSRAVEGHLRLYLVAEAVRCGASEATLATALQVLCPHQSARLKAAGGAGDLPGVMAAVGLGTTPTGQLEHAVRCAERLAWRRTRHLSALVEVGLPMLTAVAVGTMATGIWQILTNLLVAINAQMEQAPW